MTLNRKKKILAALLATAIISTAFTACNSGTANAGNTISKEQKPKGSYIETEITPPDGDGAPTGLWTHSDGSIDYLTTGQTGYALFHSTDSGATWQKVDTSSLNKVEGNIVSLDMTDAGDLYAASLINKSTMVWKISKAGEVSQIVIDEIDKAAKGSEMVFPRCLQAVGKDRFFLWFTANLGTKTSNTASEKVESAATSEVQPESTDSTASVKDSSTAASSGDSSLTKSGSASSDSSSKQMKTSDMYSNYAAIYTEKGEMVKTIDSYMINKVCTNGSMLFITDFVGHLQAFDGATGNPQANLNNELKIEQFTYEADADESGNFYYASGNGIVRVVPGSNLAETIVDGSAYTFGSPTCSVGCFEYARDGSFLIGLNTANESGKLYRYYYDENASPVPTKELTVWSLTESPSARAAIIPFQQKNKDTRVNYEVGLGSDKTAANIQDVVRTLNTELLAGGGPDVLIMDGLDYQSYIEKGLLADLTGSVSTEGLFDTLISPFKTDGKQYLIPARFSLPLVIGDKTELNKLQGLADIATATEQGAERLVFTEGTPDLLNPASDVDRPAFFFMDLRGLFDSLYSVSAPAIIDRKTGINKDSLRQLLEAMKRVSDKYKMTEPMNGIIGGGYVSITGGGTSGAPISVSQGLSCFVLGQAKYGLLNLNELELMRYATSQSSPDAIIQPGLCKGVYHPVGLTGINSGSKLRKEAAAFVQLMLGTDVQNYQVGDGLPVLSSALDGMIDRYNKSSQGGNYNHKLFSLDLKGMVAQAQTPVNSDKIISDVVYTAAESYCMRKKTLDEALRAVQSETEMYFAEKR